MFGLERIARAHHLQQFGRERRDAGHAQHLTFGQCVTDAQLPVVRNADDVAGPCFFGQFPIRGEEHDRIADCHRFFAAHMGHFHAAQKMPRGETHECHAVTVLGVHVGLHFKDKTSNLCFFG